ncbi:MAG: Gfo/Idh/MocA family oxidoreductase, partial [Armatimonadetes bacterium]|nr:Gfo/Idh/MocA family oxidoreductase [Armatimonadota bacterium]
MDRPVRLGFVGAGMMGQLAHLANYATLPGVELVALAEGRTELAEAVAARYQVGAVFADHRAMLAEARLDAVVAICPFHLNYGLARAVLEAGLHLATEKPLCVGRPAAAELVELAAARGQVYQVSYMKRWDPGVELARRQVAAWRADGEAGELLLARV